VTGGENPFNFDHISSSGPQSGADAVERFLGTLLKTFVLGGSGFQAWLMDDIDRCCDAGSRRPVTGVFGGLAVSWAVLAALPRRSRAGRFRCPCHSSHLDASLAR